MNAKMPELERAFEAAGFADVKTVASSGNVLFSAPAAPVAALERKAEAAMKDRFGNAFPAIVRPIETLRRMLASDPYQEFRLEPGAKRVVTFLRKAPKARLELPLELGGARILRVEGKAVFTAYVPSPRGALFMARRTRGSRTWRATASRCRRSPISSRPSRIRRRCPPAGSPRSTGGQSTSVEPIRPGRRLSTRRVWVTG